MKDEIKEKIKAYYVANDINKILDYITNLQTIEQQYSAILSENAELENKITNLQEENERLKLVIKNHSIIIPKNKIIDYKSRIEKAIEYIKNINERAYKDDYGTCFSTYDLLNILQGVGKDE